MIIYGVYRTSIDKQIAKLLFVTLDEELAADSVSNAEWELVQAQRVPYWKFRPQLAEQTKTQYNSTIKSIMTIDTDVGEGKYALDNYHYYYEKLSVR